MHPSNTLTHLRWLTKPFKRWAFAKGEQYTQHFSRKYAGKYIQKFMRKQRKEVNDDDGELARRIEGRNQSSALIAAKIAEHLVPTKKKPPRDVLHALVVGEIWEGVLLVGGHKSSSLRSVRPLSGLVCCLCVATVAVGP